MNSSLVGKIEKARRYAAERDQRVRFTSFTVEVRGENETHEVRLQDGRLTCGCEFFAGWGVCSHTMAMERILGAMLPKEVISQAQTALANPV